MLVGRACGGEVVNCESPMGARLEKMWDAVSVHSLSWNASVCYRGVMYHANAFGIYSR